MSDDIASARAGVIRGAMFGASWSQGATAPAGRPGLIRVRSVATDQNLRSAKRWGRPRSGPTVRVPAVADAQGRGRGPPEQLGAFFRVGAV
jgi:hypothetical protein